MSVEASTSQHSSHQPQGSALYTELSAKQRGKLPASSLLPTKTANEVYNKLGVPSATQHTKLNSKHVALTNPKRDSALRAKQKAIANAEKQKRKTAKIRGLKTRGLLPKEHRKSGNSIQWDTAIGLHKLWLGYMSELLDIELVSGNEVDLAAGTSISINPAVQAGYGSGTILGWQGKLTKADYHGAILAVTKSSNRALVGIQGIVIQETEGTFTVVTRKNKMKVLPKPGSIFTLRLSVKTAATGEVSKELAFDIAGSQFVYRAEDRAQKKWKAKTTGPFAPQV